MPITLEPGKISTTPFILFSGNTGLSAEDITKVEFKLTARDDSFNTVHIPQAKSLSTNKQITKEKSNVPEDLVGYSWEELLYHLNQCKASDLFVDRSGENVIGGFTVSTLSPKGHELLSEMRSDSIWKKLPKVGIHSLPDLLSVIKSLITLL